MKPPRSILDRAFAYNDSAKTDVRKTFARIRREQRAEDAAKAKASAEAAEKISTLPRRKASP